jgi:hypothetical protein
MCVERTGVATQVARGLGSCKYLRDAASKISCAAHVTPL